MPGMNPCREKGPRIADAESLSRMQRMSWYRVLGLATVPHAEAQIRTGDLQFLTTTAG
jgi:hypothetical protein